MKIAVLGCGWLGLPLAKELLQIGHKVSGSTTSQGKLSSLASEGIEAYIITANPEGVMGDLEEFLSGVELLIIDIPPGLRKDPEADFEGVIRKLMLRLKDLAVPRIIFISSISVFEETPYFPVYTEKDPPNAKTRSAVQLIAAEQLVLNSQAEACVIRFGGLLGGERHPVKYLAGRRGLKDPMAPVNLIDREDCIGIIKAVIACEANGVYNAVYPKHPSKQDYYCEKALGLHLEPPVFEESDSSRGKIIRPQRIIEELDYTFRKEI